MYVSYAIFYLFVRSRMQREALNISLLLVQEEAKASL